MLDREFILENRPVIERVCRVKNSDIDMDMLYRMLKQRKNIITELNELQSRKNALSKEIGIRKSRNEDCSQLFIQSKEIADSVKEKQETLKETEQKEKLLMAWIPNIPHDSVPHGKSAKFKMIRETGDYNERENNYYDMVQKNGYIDFQRGAKIAASHFPLFVGKGAYLERVIINFMIDAHIYFHGYKEVFTPYLVNESVLFSTGQLPKMKDDMYNLEHDGLYLIPTAEPPVTCIHYNEILPYNEVQKKYVAYSACFRRESGSYGKDTKGLKRIHQFNKVEMVRYAYPEESYDVLDEMVANAERILQLLGLKYRIILLPDNDLSFASAKTFDIEVWAPGSREFMEVSSISNFEDFQARRANIRFKDENNNNSYVHTLNGSGLATPRTVIALMEEYQTSDNDFEFPPVLKDYIANGVISFEKL